MSINGNSLRAISCSAISNQHHQFNYTVPFVENGGNESDFFRIFTMKRSLWNVSLLVMSDSLWPHGLLPTRLICPWNSPGKNTGVGCHFLLQGIFLTQGWNLLLLCLLHWQVDYFPLSHLGSPYKCTLYYKIDNKFSRKNTYVKKWQK